MFLAVVEPRLPPPPIPSYIYDAVHDVLFPALRPPRRVARRCPARSPRGLRPADYVAREGGCVHRRPNHHCHMVRPSELWRGRHTRCSPCRRKTDELPKGTPNKGEIVLGHITSDGSENLDIGASFLLFLVTTISHRRTATDHPLATGFLLTDGQHDITFPEDLETLDTYVLDREYTLPPPAPPLPPLHLYAVFGDSGNISPEFTIKSVGS